MILFTFSDQTSEINVKNSVKSGKKGEMKFSWDADCLIFIVMLEEVVDSDNNHWGRQEKNILDWRKSTTNQKTKRERKYHGGVAGSSSGEHSAAAKEQT